MPVPSISGNVIDLLTDRWALKRWREELASGVMASLAGVPGGVAGKIVLMDAPVPPLAASDFLPLDASELRAPVTGHQRLGGLQAHLDRRLVHPVRARARRAAEPGRGRVRARRLPENAAGQYTPYAQPIFSIPALYVDRDTGARLRTAAAGTPSTRLTLSAEVAPGTPSDSLVGLMPGDGTPTRC